MSHADVDKILALPVEERLRLLDLLMESLSADDVDTPLGDAHLALLEERLAEHALFPDDVVTHEEALALARRSIKTPGSR